MPQGPVLTRPPTFAANSVWRVLAAGQVHTLQFVANVTYEGVAYTRPKFVILHFEVLGGARLQANQTVRITLNNTQTDTFARSDGNNFWTRPISSADAMGLNVSVDVGAGESIQLLEYGYGVLDLFMIAGDPSSGIADFLADGVAGAAPAWAPITDLQPNDPRRQRAESVGLMVFIRIASDGAREIGTCTASVFKDNWIITCAHCADTLIGSHPAYPQNEEDYRFLEIESGSFTLDYNPLPAGTNLAANMADRPKFYKLFEPERTGFRYSATVRNPELEGVDYIVIQVRQSDLDVLPFPSALSSPQNIPPTVLSPGDGAQLYIIHHPRGRTKRISYLDNTGDFSKQAAPADYLAPVGNFHNRNIVTICDLDSGSSGAPILLRGSNEIVGIARDVSINGNAANNYLHNWGPRIRTIMRDLVENLDDPNPISFDQYIQGAILVDSSGSMGLTDTGSGNTKMYDTKQALEKFLKLLRYTNAAPNQHNIAVIEYDTVNNQLRAMSPFFFATESARDTYVNNLVNALQIGGATAIGDALIAGAAQVNTALPANFVPSILLMTDGIQNWGTSLDGARPSLDAITNLRLHAIGFGENDALNSNDLRALAEDYRGDFLRDGDGLNIKKFFAIEYGQMLETGVSIDPARIFQAGSGLLQQIPFHVIDEDSLTACIAWDRPDSELLIDLITPTGSVLSSADAVVHYEAGETWSFIRVELPVGGEKAGLWHAQIRRQSSDLSLRGHNAPVAQLAFSPDGLHLLSASTDGDLRLWNLRFGRSVRQFFRNLSQDSNELAPVAVEFSASNQFGMVASRSGHASQLVNLDTGQVFLRLLPPAELIESETLMLNAVLTPDDSWLVGAFDDFGLIFWLLNDLQFNGYSEHTEYSSIPDEGIIDIAADPLGRYIAVLAAGSTEFPGLSLISLANAEFTRSSIDAVAEFAEQMLRLVFSRDGQYIFIALADGTILRLEHDTGEFLVFGEDTGLAIQDLTAHPDAQRVLACLLNTDSAYLSHIDGSILQTYDGHTAPVLSVALSPDGHVAATASQDSHIRLWNTFGGTALHQTEAYDERYAFVNVIDAGVFMRPIPISKAVFTGDTLYPQVLLRFKNGARLVNATVTLEITRPTESLGAKLLANPSGQQEPENITMQGDTLDRRQSLVIGLHNRQSYNRNDAIEASFVGENEYNYSPVPDAMHNTVRSVVSTETRRFTLFDDGKHFDGAMEPDGIFGAEIQNLTQFEGEYQFHAIAQFGSEMQYSREVFWTMTVLPLLDAGTTEFELHDRGQNSNGRDQFTIRFFPRDINHNPLGPGLASYFNIEPAKGNMIVQPCREMGGGYYEVDISWTGQAKTRPSIIIHQSNNVLVMLPNISDEDN